MTKLKRNIPLPVRTKLRQEAFFGCCECGEPILDFHHIIPWSEEKHNNPSHMIAVCPTHHREIAKKSRDYAYALKENPYNKSRGKFRGELSTDKEKPVITLGTHTVKNCINIITYFEVTILRYRIFDGQSLISLFIPDSNFWPDLKIIDNDIIANPSIFWDIEFSTNYLRFRKQKGETFIEIDLRGESARFSGNFTIGGRKFIFSPEKANLPGLNASNCTFEDGGTCFRYGDGQSRLILPNYAMSDPRSFLVTLQS